MAWPSHSVSSQKFSQSSSECARGLDPGAPAMAGVARQHAEAVLAIASCGLRDADVPLPLGAAVTPWAEIAIFAADGHVETYEQSASEQFLCVRFRQEDGRCGVHFRRPCAAGEIVYCPCGFEAEGYCLDLDRLRPGTVWLTPPNGLVSLSSDLHLIRVNAACPVAAAVGSQDPWIRFDIEAPEGKIHEWRFVLARGDLQSALVRANALNGC